MAFALLDLDKLPPPSSAGKSATAPSVGVHNNGQITFNSFITKSLNGAVGMGIQVDGKKVLFAPINAEQLEKLTKARKVAFELRRSKKASSAYIGGARLLTAMGYDYKAAGNQRFEVTMDAKNQVILTIPDSTPAAKAVIPRPSRKKKGEVVTMPGTDAERVPAAVTAPASTRELNMEDILK